MEDNRPNVKDPVEALAHACAAFEHIALGPLRSTLKPRLSRSHPIVPY